MTLAEVLAEVRRRGIRLTPGRTPGAPILLREHKPALLALLGQQPPASGPPPVTPPPQAPATAPAAPPASAPDPPGGVGRPVAKQGRATVPHELSLAERVACGYVNPGWRPLNWAARLRQLAARCEALRPELAELYRRWAHNVTKGAT